MSESPKSKSSVKTVVKPMNIFYVWYVELCRRANITPLATVKSAKTRNETVLDFITDRIKTDEWTPIINAIGLDTSLHVIAIRSRIPLTFSKEINTEEKVRHMKRQTGVIFTDYFFNSLIRSVSSCLINNTVISTLELEGLPLHKDYLILFLENLKKNKTLKKLSLKDCPIEDEGCNQLCNILQTLINIEVLNLSGCNLSSISGQYIAKVIKFQQINRYCETWHKSLRYEEPNAKLMAGLKRISINDNPEIGDEGLGYILNELGDDLWIKALDMQKCNITEKMSEEILKALENNNSLSVADFRNNSLSRLTMEKIFEKYNNDSEYEWCQTTSTLHDGINLDQSETNFSEMSVGLLQKTKSVPSHTCGGSYESDSKTILRKSKTVTCFDRQSKFNNNSCKEIIAYKKQLWELNFKLGEEIRKRKDSEKKNNELKEKMKSMSTIEQIPPNTCTKIIRYVPIQKEKTYFNHKTTSNNKLCKPKKSTGSLKRHARRQEVITENHHALPANFGDANHARNLFDVYLNTETKDNGKLLLINNDIDEIEQSENNCLTYYYNDDNDNLIAFRDEKRSENDSADYSKSMPAEMKPSANDTSKNHSQQLNNKNSFRKLTVEVR